MGQAQGSQGVGSSPEGAVPVCVGLRWSDSWNPAEGTEFAELPEDVEDNSRFKENQANGSLFSQARGVQERK